MRLFYTVSLRSTLAIFVNEKGRIRSSPQSAKEEVIECVPYRLR
jgi:hypothetical protein